MSITYTFDRDSGLIKSTPAGMLTVDDTLEYFRRLASDPDCPEAAIEIVDFSQVTDFKLRYSELGMITQHFQPTKAAKRILATVFVCTSELSYGIGRTLQALYEGAEPRHVVRLASSPEELENVIKECGPGRRKQDRAGNPLP
jgi:hypothetical protein